jgi:hypothetical protein
MLSGVIPIPIQQIAVKEVNNEIPFLEPCFALILSRSRAFALIRVIRGSSLGSTGSGGFIILSPFAILIKF